MGEQPEAQVLPAARAGGRYALTTMGIGGGQGIAATFERI